ncbi:MAG: FRG domain-containing protein [Reyranella sp.]|nr:FRG domain-containing protein [Reyranella sp.]
MLYESAFKIDHLQRFKYASRGRRGPNPPKLQTDDEWWALGQHYGLATPLLDWTTSPFAAAFFAFEQEDGFKQTRYRAIWGLQTVKVLSAVARTFEADKREAAKIEKELRDQGIQRGDIAHSILWSKPQYQVGFVRPLSDENPRLVNQGGLFTKTPPEQTLDDWVKAHVPENERSFVLVKMLVPTKERLKVLRMLNRMNINQSTMFPDLGGAAQFCNMSAQIEGY